MEEDYELLDTKWKRGLEEVEKKKLVRVDFLEKIYQEILKYETHQQILSKEISILPNSAIEVFNFATPIRISKFQIYHFYTFSPIIFGNEVRYEINADGRSFSGDVRLWLFNYTYRSNFMFEFAEYKFPVSIENIFTMRVTRGASVFPAPVNLTYIIFYAI